MDFQLAICDDDKYERASLVEYCKNISFAKHIVSVTTFGHGKELLSEYREKHKPYDVIILDIRMPQLSGHQVAHKIREVDKNVAIMFLSNDKDPNTITEGYKVNAYRYMIKPVTQHELADNLNSLFYSIEKEMESGRQFVISSKYGAQRIHYEEIYYIESMGRKVNIHTLDRSIAFYKRFKDIENDLINENFFCINKGCLVNINFIRLIDKKLKQLILLNSVVLPITKTKVSLVEKLFVLHKVGELTL